MRNLSAPALVALMLVCTVPSHTATSIEIGSVTANGSFLVDSSKIWHTATLFDGNMVETSAAPSDVRLKNGMRIRLDHESRARVYGGRIVLERGSSELQGGVDKPLEVRTLKILSPEAGSVAQVRLNGSGRVLVAAVKGSLRVTNAAGILVANLAAPGTLTFDPEAGTVTQVSGCLLTKDGKYLIADQTTNVTMEVHGRGLEKQVGNRVAVTGTADEAAASLAGASQSITVTEVKLVSKGGCASVAKVLGAAGGAAAAGAGGAVAGGGISTAATVAIVGGVAVAATLGGLAAVGTIGGDDRPATSR